MDVYEAIYTTRAMRRVKPDPIPEDILKKIMGMRAKDLEIHRIPPHSVTCNTK